MSTTRGDMTPRYRVTFTKGPRYPIMHGGVAVFAAARLANGQRLSARLYLDAGPPNELGERKATLVFPGKAGFAPDPVELELGERVELLAGDEVFLTCEVAR